MLDFLGSIPKAGDKDIFILVPGFETDSSSLCKGSNKKIKKGFNFKLNPFIFIKTLMTFTIWSLVFLYLTFFAI